MELNPGIILLITVGVVLLIILIALFGGGMAMMAGMMGTPIDWVALIIIGLLALGAYLYFLRGSNIAVRRQLVSEREIPK